MNNKNMQAGRLADVVRVLAERHRARLDELRLNGRQVSQPTFIWDSIVMSLATHGNSRGARLVQERWDEFTFDAVGSIPEASLASVMELRFRACKVRMPAIKAQRLVANHRRVVELGGLEAARLALLEQKTKTAIIRWWRAFDGIGAKYARDIMLDAYHPAFRDTVAVAAGAG